MPIEYASTDTELSGTECNFDTSGEGCCDTEQPSKTVRERLAATGGQASRNMDEANVSNSYTCERTKQTSGPCRCQDCESRDVSVGSSAILCRLAVCLMRGF